MNNDIPPLPPNLCRKTSLNMHQSRQQHYQRTNNYKNSSSNNNNINVASTKIGHIGGGGVGGIKLNNCENSAALAINYSQQTLQQHQQQQQQLHKPMNNKPDLFNFSSSAANATIIDHKNKLLLNDNTTMPDELSLNMKPYPPFYFDDNHFHHCIGSGVGGGGGVGINGVNGTFVQGQKENEVFFYHQDQANYIPNYDSLSFKYNTIGPQTKFHASTCNLNHFHDGNLMNGHQWTSLSNFNQATPVLPYHQFHTGGTTFGGSSLIGGSFNSTGSISEKKDISWKHRNCPSRNSSSSSTNSASKYKSINRSNLYVYNKEKFDKWKYCLLTKITFTWLRIPQTKVQGL